MISPRTITIASAVIGAISLVTLFMLTTVWLYRRRFGVPIQDEEAVVHTDAKHSYPFDHKTFRLLAPPKVARIAPLSFRTADAFSEPAMYGAAAAAMTTTTTSEPNEKAAKHTSLSPPPLSSVWRGRQWVTVTRPKTPRKKTPNPISEKVVVSQPEKRSKVQRLSAIISKLKSDFMDVQL